MGTTTAATTMTNLHFAAVWPRPVPRATIVNGATAWPDAHTPHFQLLSGMCNPCVCTTAITNTSGRQAAVVAEGEGQHKRTMRQTPEERVSTSQRGQSPSPSHPATHPVSARHHAPEQSGFCRRTNSRSQFALRPSSGCRECICTFINQTHQRPTRST